MNSGPSILRDEFSAARNVEVAATLETNAVKYLKLLMRFSMGLQVTRILCNPHGLQS